MRAVTQLLSVILILLSVFGSLSMKGSYISSGVIEALASGVQASQLSVITQLTQVEQKSENHGGPCEDSHAFCHQCFLGHCAFVECASSELTPLKSSNFSFLVSHSSLIEVVLSGPRKPPRV